MKRLMLALATRAVAASALAIGTALPATAAPLLAAALSQHERSPQQAEPPQPIEPLGNLAPVARAPGRDLYRVTYVGGEPAEVEIEYGGPAALALHVYDASRKLVCRSREAGNVQRCRWSPPLTAPYWIEVRNDTGSDLAYRLRTN
jgi:hypothetical protein